MLHCANDTSTNMKILYTAVVFMMVLTATTKAQAKSRHFQWITNDSALRWLTVEMSNMDYFRSTLLQPFLVPRESGSEGNIAVQKLIKSFLKYWHIEEYNFTANTPYGNKEFTNIVATFDPSKPTKIVLACHFDSKYMPGKIFVAATDSAVPCSIMLETVRQLQCLLEKGSRNQSLANDLTLQLIFFDGEEAFKEWTDTDSLYGARHLANVWSTEVDPVHNVTRLAEIRELILLDLMGTRDTVIPQQFTSTSDLYKHLVKIERHLRANNYLTGGHEGPIFTGVESWGGIQDDHLPFLHKGVDVCHLISEPFPSVWHETTDDENHLDYYLIDDMCRIFRVFISNLLHLQSEDRGCR